MHCCKKTFDTLNLYNPIQKVWGWSLRFVCLLLNGDRQIVPCVLSRTQGWFCAADSKSGFVFRQQCHHLNEHFSYGLGETFWKIKWMLYIMFFSLVLLGLQHNKGMSRKHSWKTHTTKSVCESSLNLEVLSGGSYSVSLTTDGKNVLWHNNIMKMLGLIQTTWHRTPKDLLLNLLKLNISVVANIRLSKLVRDTKPWNPPPFIWRLQT